MRSRSSHRSSSLINSWRYFSSCLARRLCSADGCAEVALEFVRVIGSQSLEKSGSGWPSLRARVCFPALSVPAPVYARLATSPLRAAKDRMRRPSLYEHNPSDSDSPANVLESEQSLSGGGRRERLNHGGASLSGRSFFNFTLLSHESLCLRPLLLVEGRRARHLTLFSWRRHSISWAWYKPRSVLVPCPSDGGTTRGTTGGTRGHDIEASVHGNRGGEDVGRGDRCRQEAGDKRNHRAREGGRHRVRVAGRRTRRRRDVPARQRHDNGGDAAELLESFGDQLDAYKEQVAYQVAYTSAHL
jgi:hypothetical protein